MRIAISRPIAGCTAVRGHHLRIGTASTLDSIFPQRRQLCIPLFRTHPRPSIQSGGGGGAFRFQARRNIITESLPVILVPPFVFTSLLLVLWTYKCIMTVLFQDKIIYMPYMPPFARSEKMEDYTATCKPVVWEKHDISSVDRTKISLCLGRISNAAQNKGGVGQLKKHVVICYFQGNGSSTPPRLPMLSNVVRSIQAQIPTCEDGLQYSLVALSYRGYWTSSGRASQRGIELDAQALLQWVRANHAQPGMELEIILWGQSIGAGVASTAAATYLLKAGDGKPPIIGLILETPFSGIKSMLIALYPQKWLPYRYLWPFLWNHWDSVEALRRIAARDQRVKVLLLPATRDEVVPPGEVDKLEQISRDVGLPTNRIDIMGALHTEATTRREGQQAVAQFVIEATKTKHEL